MAETSSNPVGRPSGLTDKVKEQACKLALMGLTDDKMADIIGVVHSTFQKWKLDDPEFSDSLKEAKDYSDSNVVQSLYEKACSGDTTAAIFWLKNRQRHNWRDKIDHGLTDNDGKDVKLVADPLEIARKTAFLLRQGVEYASEQEG